MSVIDRLRGAWHGLTGAVGGVSDLRHPTAWLQNSLGGMPTAAGVRVTPSTSLTVGAYYRAIALVSASVAKMPVRVVRVNGKHREPMEGHAIARLLSRRPNGESTAWDFAETMTQWAMGYGNGIAVIERDRNGNPIALWPRPPGEIRLEIDDRLPLGDPLRVMYEWNSQPGSGRTRFLMADDVLHVKGMGSGLWGYSVADFMRRTTGESIAQDVHGGAFYGNAARPGGVLTHPASLKPEAQENLLNGFNRIYQGSENHYKTILLMEGATWAPMTMPAKDAQFLESRKFSVTEVARWFGIPPHKLGDLENATFSNIEHLSIEYVQDAVLPWACRWESEAARKLLGVRSGNLVIDYDESVLIRGDSVQQAERTRTAISTAVMTPNEGRISLGLNPVTTKGADDLFLQGAMATLEKIVDPPEPPPPVVPNLPAEPDDPEGDPEPEPPTSSASALPAIPVVITYDDGAAAKLFHRAAERLTRKETRAVGSNASMEPDAKFIKWANGWYAEVHRETRDEFAPLFALYPGADLSALEGVLGEIQRVSLVSALEHYRAGDLAEWIESYEPDRATALADALHNIARGLSHVEA